MGIQEIHPQIERAQLGIQVLRAGLNWINPGSPTRAKVNEVLQRSVHRPPVCPNGHLLQPIERNGWFVKVPPCYVCGKVSDGQRHGCLQSACAFELCASCLQEGRRLGGHRSAARGGVFADVTTLELAQALLRSDGWLKYRCAGYFNRVDAQGKGVLDKEALGPLVSRLCAELGLKPFKLEDLRGAKELDQKMLVSFIREVLQHAVLH